MSFTTQRISKRERIGSVRSTCITTRQLQTLLFMDTMKVTGLPSEMICAGGTRGTSENPSLNQLPTYASLIFEKMGRITKKHVHFQQMSAKDHNVRQLDLRQLRCCTEPARTKKRSFTIGSWLAGVHQVMDELGKSCTKL